MMENLARGLQALWLAHRGAMSGLFLGLLIGLSVLAFGFWRTLFVVVCCCLGLAVGRRFDQQQSSDEVLDDFWDGITRRLPGRFQHFR